MNKPNRDRRIEDRRTGDRGGQDRNSVTARRAYEASLAQVADSRVVAKLRAQC